MIFIFTIAKALHAATSIERKSSGRERVDERTPLLINDETAGDVAAETNDDIDVETRAIMHETSIVPLVASIDTYRETTLLFTGGCKEKTIAEKNLYCLKMFLWFAYLIDLVGFTQLSQRVSVLLLHNMFLYLNRY